MIKQDLIGKTFGQGKVTKFVGNKRRGNTSNRSCRVWELTCSCGNTYQAITEFLNNGDVSSCGCQKKLFQRHNKTKTTISRYLKHLRYDAKARKRQFNITIEQLNDLMTKQDNKCALSGLPVSFDDSSASLDRIDNSQDYFINNVQWVHRKINYMKNTLEQNDFIELCRFVSLKNTALFKS